LEGLSEIVAIKASVNKGLSSDLKAAFPDIKPFKKPALEGKILIKNPQ
jgi:hypothetical protein